MNTPRTIGFVWAVAASVLLAGCVGQTRDAGPAPTSSAPEVPAPEGRTYGIIPDQSLLTILVYRGGTLARMGHNHVIASRDLSGQAHVPPDLTQASFKIRIPVAKLTVDDPVLREAAGPDFPPGVPDSAKQGTRQNMLSEALLDGDHHPEIILRTQRVDVSAPNELLIQVQVLMKGQPHLVTIPVRYELTDESLSASGEFTLKHSELGLTPFSVMLGAMQVQDEMKIRFQLHFAPSSVSNASAR